jgi:Mn-dependent DtxR family transcriptional regulator
LANARQVEKSNSVHLFVSKNILASQLSIKPETLSRILKELSKQGLIEVNNSHILLLRPLELESLVNI